MSEDGGTNKVKRNRIRPFPNPPQPHMCIRSVFQGTSNTCYVNVLSWNRVTLNNPFSYPFAFYGGFIISPPREKQNVTVFVAVAHPHVLATNGKYAVDTQKRATFVESVLEFLEKTLEGVALSRIYTIMDDCNIVGELKDIWIAVQDRNDIDCESYGENTWKEEQKQDENPPSYPTELVISGQCQNTTDVEESKNESSNEMDSSYFENVYDPQSGNEAFNILCTSAMKKVKSIIVTTAEQRREVELRLESLCIKLDREKKET